MKTVERQRGNRIGFWIFRTAIRIFGLRGAYGLLYIVCLYYLLLDRAVVAACLAYVKRRFPGHSAARKIFDVYLLFVNQGKSLIDRYYIASGAGDIVIERRGFEKVQEILARGNRGFVLLTAHVGNWQIAMTAMGGFGTAVHTMMRREDNAAVRETLNIDSEDETVKIIYTDDPVEGAIEAIKAINRGGIVSIMGDRTYDYSSTEALFLGGNVRFPFGAFTLAAAAECPVVVLLSAKTGLKKYIADFTCIIRPPERVREKERRQ